MIGPERRVLLVYVNTVVQRWTAVLNDLSFECPEGQGKREEVKEQWSEHMLDDIVDCYLTETDTITLLDMPGVSVSVDAEDAESVRLV